MRKFITILFFLIILTPAFGQITLTKEQMEALPSNVVSALETVTKIDSISTNINKSWGHEIGVAVDEALSAVEEHATNIANSNLGHTVIFLVCWRFLFNDAIGLIVGIILLGCFIWLIKLIVKHTKEENFNDLDEDTQAVFIVVSWIGVLALLIAALCCIF